MIFKIRQERNGRIYLTEKSFALISYYLWGEPTDPGELNSFES